MYSKVGNKTFKEMEQELKRVYIDYYQNDEDLNFIKTVKLFANDDFYNLHFVAKEYLKLYYKRKGAGL